MGIGSGLRGKWGVPSCLFSFFVQIIREERHRRSVQSLIARFSSVLSYHSSKTRKLVRKLLSNTEQSIIQWSPWTFRHGHAE